MGFLDPAVSDYLTELAAHQRADATLDDMESRAREHGFPIVGRAVGVFLELIVRSIGAQRVMELGSGYGYSAYWFARAVGATGHVICTDGDARNAQLAERYLTAADLWQRVSFRVGDALDGMAAEEGLFDIVYCDIDKHGYPAAWQAARDRVRMGGLYLCDNTLWDGRVASGGDREGLEGWTAAIQEHNVLVAADERFLSSIVPIRDGVLTALRIA